MSLSPPVSSLRALEAVVRNGSIQKAARELFVSPSAVSHQLAALQELSDGPLFTRSGRQLEPTDLALAVINELGDAYQKIKSAHAVLIGATSSNIVNVVAPTTFTMGWLFRKLEDFIYRYPEIQLNLEPSDSPLLRREYDPDVLITQGRRPDGESWKKLYDDVRVVIGKPGTFADVNGDFSKLYAKRLIHVDFKHDEGRFTWSDWFAWHGVAPSHQQTDLRVAHNYLALRMATRGDGIAHTDLRIAQPYVEAGEIEILPNSETPSTQAYWWRTMNTRKSNREAVALFVQWLHELLATTP